MDELKIVFWIVIGLIYLFSRRKKKAAPQPPRETGQEYESQETKPLTFEELLQEIQGMKKKEEPAPAVPTYYDQPPEPKKWEPYPYDAEKVRKQIEDTQYDYRKHDKIYEVYENATKEAFVRPSLEESMKLGDTIVRFDQFKEYAAGPRNKFLEEYIKELKDPSGFKKAFIMSEIITRRF